MTPPPAGLHFRITILITPFRVLLPSVNWFLFRVHDAPIKEGFQTSHLFITGNKQGGHSDDPLNLTVLDWVNGIPRGNE